jgi:hypothetical protein
MNNHRARFLRIALPMQENARRKPDFETKQAYHGATQFAAAVNMHCAEAATHSAARVHSHVIRLIGSFFDFTPSFQNWPRSVLRIDDGYELTPVKEREDPERTQLFVVLVESLIPVSKDVRPSFVKCAATPQIIWDREPKDVCADSCIFNSILNSMVMRKAANDLPDDPNHPRIVSGVNHLPILAIHRHRHEPLDQFASASKAIFLLQAPREVRRPEFSYRVVGLTGKQEDAAKVCLVI